MAATLLRIRLDQPVVLRTRGPGGDDAYTPATPEEAIVAVIGPQGPQGAQGSQGVAGDGATDPGDLTLIFDNRLV